MKNAKTLSLADKELISACSDGDIERAAAALSRGARLELEGIQRPLFLAATYGHAELFRWLLDRGADVSTATATEETVLSEAASHDHVDIVDMCLDAGASMDHWGKWGTALEAAIASGAVRVVRRLLERGAKLNVSPKDAPNSIYSPTVHFVARAMKRDAYANGVAQEILRALVSAGADVTERDGYGETMLHAACKNSHMSVSMFESLLELGIPVDARDDWGVTPLWEAARCNRLDLVRVLLSRGADPTARTTKESAISKAETSVYEIARKHADLPVLAALRDAGASPSGPEPQGPPPSALDRFRVGATVIHPKFGAGQILASEGAGTERKLTVKFSDATRVLRSTFVSAG